VSGTPPLLRGGARAAEATRETRVEFSVLDLGPEKLVARYVGSDEWVAFNESVLRESLDSLQGQAWGARIVNPATVEWSSAAASNGGSALPMPIGWTIIAAGPTRCAGIPQPTAAATALATQDFALTLRAGLWPAPPSSPEQAAAACSVRRGALGAASYATRAEWLGVTYSIEGTFIRTGNQLVQLEVSSTEDRAATARSVLAAWVKLVSPP
jgi:hypothetical protein